MGQTGTGKYEELLERCRPLEPVVTAVAHPCEESALAAAVEAGAKGLITPILVGPAGKIDEVAKKGGIDLGNIRVIDAAHSHASAAKECVCGFIDSVAMLAWAAGPCMPMWWRLLTEGDLCPA